MLEVFLKHHSILKFVVIVVDNTSWAFTKITHEKDSLINRRKSNGLIQLKVLIRLCCTAHVNLEKLLGLKFSCLLLLCSDFTKKCKYWVLCVLYKKCLCSEACNHNTSQLSVFKKGSVQLRTICYLPAFT